VARAVARCAGADYQLIAVEDRAGAFDYARPVLARIARDDPGTGLRAAAAVNKSNADVVDLQHEYGLFGGPAGADLLGFLEHVRKPVVTTFHTALPDPDPTFRRVTREISARSARVVVLAQAGADILARHYGIERRHIHLIPHGVPNIRWGDDARRAAKARLGLDGRMVLCTFGLLGRGKGIEETLRALPAVIEADPSVVYVVAGVTHPAVVRHEGEAYRESLAALVAELGLSEHVRFENRYLRIDEIVRYLEATDVYIMAYYNPDQVVSGTLAYAVGAGRAVVATPFTYAREVLADGRGMIVPFADARALADAVRHLLTRPEERAAIERRAFAATRGWQWPRVGELYHGLCRDAIQHERATVATRSPAATY